MLIFQNKQSSIFALISLGIVAGVLLFIAFTQIPVVFALSCSWQECTDVYVSGYWGQQWDSCQTTVSQCVGGYVWDSCASTQNVCQGGNVWSSCATTVLECVGGNVWNSCLYTEYVCELFGGFYEECWYECVGGYQWNSCVTYQDVCQGGYVYDSCATTVSQCVGGNVWDSCASTQNVCQGGWVNVWVPGYWDRSCITRSENCPAESFGTCSYPSSPTCTNTGSRTFTAYSCGSAGCVSSTVPVTCTRNTNGTNCGTQDCDSLDTTCRDYYDVGLYCSGGVCPSSATCNSYSNESSGVNCGTVSCSSGASGSCTKYCNGSGSCSSCTPSCTETNCADGVDNDGDGATDNADSDCCTPNWSCINWTPSASTKSCGTTFPQTGTASDSNNCGTTSGQPTCSQSQNGTYCSPLDCDSLDTTCRDYHDVSKTCIASSYCSSPSCTSYTNRNESGSCAGGTGICSSGECAIDATPPSTPTINSPSSGSWQDDPSFSVSVSNDSDVGVSGIENCYYHVYDSSAGWTKSWANRTCNSSFSVSVGSSGDCRVQGANSCTVYVFSKDNAGNTSASRTRSFSVDYIDPNVGTISPTSAVVDVSQTFSVSASDNVSLASCDFVVDTVIKGQMSISGSTASKSYTFNAAGTYQVHATCYDSAGNPKIGANVSVEAVAPDITPPIVWITGAPSSWTNQSVTAVINCSDPGGECDLSTIAYRVYTYDPGFCSRLYTDYTIGSSVIISAHRWVCGAAKDKAGNTGFSTPQSTSMETRDTITAYVKSMLDILQIKEIHAATTPSSVPVLPVEFTVDNAPPTSSITYPSYGSWQTGDFYVLTSDSDTGGSPFVYCNYGVYSAGTGWTIPLPSYVTMNRSCGSAITISVGPSGNCRDEGVDKCQVQINSRDLAGNESLVGVRTFSIDYTPPFVGTISPTSALVDVSQTFSVSASDNISLASCDFVVDDVVIGQMSISGGTASKSYTFNAGGTHQVHATCYDSVGNAKIGANVAVVANACSGIPILSTDPVGAVRENTNLNLIVSGLSYCQAKPVHFYKIGFLGPIIFGYQPTVDSTGIGYSVLVTSDDYQAAKRIGYYAAVDKNENGTVDAGERTENVYVDIYPSSCNKNSTLRKDEAIQVALSNGTICNVDITYLGQDLADNSEVSYETFSENRTSLTGFKEIGMDDDPDYRCDDNIRFKNTWTSLANAIRVQSEFVDRKWSTTHNLAYGYTLSSNNCVFSGVNKENCLRETPSSFDCINPSGINTNTISSYQPYDASDVSLHTRIRESIYKYTLVECAEDLDCTGDEKCDLITNTCVECTEPIHCTGGETCDLTTHTCSDNTPPDININTVTNRWYKENPFLDVDFSDAVGLDSGFYQIDSYTGAWKYPTSDGYSIQTVDGTSFSVNWKISKADWDNLSQGRHTIYFSAIDDNNKRRGEDGSKSLVIRKDTIPPSSSFDVSSVASGYRVSDNTYWFKQGTYNISVTDEDPGIVGVNASGLDLGGCWNYIVDTTAGRNRSHFGADCNSTLPIKVGPSSDSSVDCVTEGGNKCYICVASYDIVGNYGSQCSWFSVDRSPPTSH